MMEYDLLQDLADMFKEATKDEYSRLTWMKQAKELISRCNEIKQRGCSDETHIQLNKEIEQTQKNLEEDQAKLKQRILDWLATEIIRRLE